MVSGAGARRKGSWWQRQVVLWLDGRLFHTSTRGTGYTGDDVVAHRGRLGLSVECKNTKALDLAGSVDQSVANAGDLLPLTVIHRRGRSSVDDAYFVLRGRDFARLMSLLGTTVCNHPQHGATESEETPRGRISE